MGWKHIVGAVAVAVAAVLQEQVAVAVTDTQE